MLNQGDWRGPKLPGDWQLKAKKGIDQEFEQRVCRLPEPLASDARADWAKLKAKLKSGDLSDLPWPPTDLTGKCRFGADTQSRVSVVLEAFEATEVLLVLRITLKE